MIQAQMNILIQHMIRKRIRMRSLSVESLLWHLNLHALLLRCLRLRLAIFFALLALMRWERHDWNE